MGLVRAELFPITVSAPARSITAHHRQKRGARSSISEPKQSRGV